MEKGVSAAEAAEYLDGGTVSFEAFLKERHLIATVEEIEALCRRYAGSADGVTVTVEKKDLPLLDDFAQGDLTAEEAAARLAETE